MTAQPNYQYLHAFACSDTILNLIFSIRLSTNVCKTSRKKIENNEGDWPAVWSGHLCAFAEAHYSLSSTGSPGAPAPMGTCTGSSHHETPAPQVPPLPPLCCWSLTETVQTGKISMCLVGYNNVISVWLLSMAAPEICLQKWRCEIRPHFQTFVGNRQTLTFLHHLSLCLVQWSSHWEEVRGEQNHTKDVWVTSAGLAMKKEPKLHYNFSTYFMFFIIAGHNLKAHNTLVRRRDREKEKGGEWGVGSDKSFQLNQSPLKTKIIKKIHWQKFRKGESTWFSCWLTGKVLYRYAQYISLNDNCT